MGVEVDGVGRRGRFYASAVEILDVSVVKGLYFLTEGDEDGSSPPDLSEEGRYGLYAKILGSLYGFLVQGVWSTDEGFANGSFIVDHPFFEVSSLYLTDFGVFHRFDNPSLMVIFGIAITQRMRPGVAPQDAAETLSTPEDTIPRLPGPLGMED